MDQAAETKVCPHCAETIKIAAKVCPHCRFCQKTWSLYNPKIIAASVLILVIGYSVLMGLVVDSISGEGRDFAEYRDQIRVATSSMNFSQTSTNAYITAVGTMTNGSAFTWKEVQLEAQYFDASGKLIDTGLNRNFDT